MKLIKVDMTAKTIQVEDLPSAYAGLGGRALTSNYINDHVPAGCDPLGPENLLIFAPGYFSGTPLVNTSRLSVGAKSPLTGGIKESNVGGTAAAALANLGISALVVEGQAPEGESWLLKIDAEGQVELIDGADCRGMRTYALAEKLLAAHGPKNNITLHRAGRGRPAERGLHPDHRPGRPPLSGGRSRRSGGGHGLQGT